MTSTATLPANKTHLDIHDQSERQSLAEILEVSEDKLKKAARMVGTRISTIRSYLGK
jgi:transcriptional regulator with GAF, ATPase, and Fis domain